MSIPASASVAMPSTETYFVAATIVTSVPTSSRIRARRAAISSADNAENSLLASRPARAPLREEQIGPAASAQVDAFDVGRAGVAGRLLRSRPQVELAVADDPVAEAAAEGPRDLLPHLVATGTDRRADHRCEVLTHHLGTRLDDAVDQSAPTRVHDGE